MKLGIISDTHNLLRPEVHEAFAGVDHILHAGDVGEPDILVELESIAPVTVVHGNTDGMRLRRELPETARVELGGAECFIIHGHQLGSPTPEKLVASHPDVDLLVFGHTHQPVISKVGSVLAVNPGSAGPTRFGVRPTVAVAEVQGGAIEVVIRQL